MTEREIVIKFLSNELKEQQRSFNHHLKLMTNHAKRNEFNPMIKRAEVANRFHKRMVLLSELIDKAAITYEDESKSNLH